MDRAWKTANEITSQGRATTLSNLRIWEVLFLGFLSYLSVAAFLFPLDGRQRLAVIALNALAASVIVTLSRHDPARRPFLGVVRDWIPSIPILVAYRESGLLVTPDPTHRLDHILIRLDDLILKNPWVVGALEWSAPWLQRYLEFAYLLCYPVVPLGLASLYMVRRNAAPTAGRASCPRPAGSAALPSAALQGGARACPYGPAMEHFWTAVLLASFTCYLLFPLFPLVPPRELFNDLPGPPVAPVLRGMNHWLLGKYAVGASLFPSAHVAATTAVALVIRRYLPRFGWLFVIAAASIALATVYGRYHYAADALAGALVGLGAFHLSTRIVRAEPLRTKSGSGQ